MDPGATLATALLIAVRLVPIAAVAPVLGGPLAPWPARVALTALAAVALALAQPPGVAAAIAAAPAGALVALALKELAVGAVLAAIVAAPFVAAETAGRWIGVALGPADAGGAAIGPTGSTRTTGLVIGLLAVVVFFAIDGHLVVIAALARSYEAIPLAGGPGGGLDRAIAAREVLAAIVGVVAAAVALAAPALVAAALVELVLGLTGRAGGPAPAAAALRGAAVAAFVAAGLLLLAAAIARGVGGIADALGRIA